MDNNENFDYDMDEIEMPVLESLDGSDFSDEKPSVEHQDFVAPRREAPVQTEVRNLTTNEGWQERQEKFYAANYDQEKLHNLEYGEKIVKALCVFMYVTSFISIFLSLGAPSVVTNGLRVWMIHKFYNGGFLPWLGLTIMNFITGAGFFTLASKVEWLSKFGYVPNPGLLQFVYVIFGIGYILAACLMAFDKRIRTYCT